MEDKTMLKVENLSVNYGHIEALKNDRELLIDKTISSLLRLANLAFSFSEQEIKEIK